MAFIFGHTHKPFEQIMSFDNFSASAVATYNTGGWVVDSAATQPLFGGAVVLISDKLEIASLRMFSQCQQSSDYAVSLAHAGPPPGKNSWFAQLAALVNAQEDPRRGFSPQPKPSGFTKAASPRT